jgi:hypothetical protein
LKCDIEQADHLVLFDSSPLDDERLVTQIKPSGSILANMRGPLPRPKKSEGLSISLVDALEISLKHGLGAIINTAMLGAYGRFSGLVQMDTLFRVMRETLPSSIVRTRCNEDALKAFTRNGGNGASPWRMNSGSLWTARDPLSLFLLESPLSSELECRDRSACLCGKSAPCRFLPHRNQYCGAFGLASQGDWTEPLHLSRRKLSGRLREDLHHPCEAECNRETR